MKSRFFPEKYAYNPPSTMATIVVEEKKKVKKKDTIDKNIRSNVWNTYIGEDIAKHKCLCCKRTTIKMTDFHVGHVLSEKCGGTLAITNLRPICASCNHGMRTENMIDYVKKYELFIG